MQVFVDESKAKGFVLVAALVEPPDLDDARRGVRELVLPGQKRIHFVKESDSRRRLILDRLIALGLTTTIYRAGPHHRTDWDRRAACLHQLVHDHASARETLLYLETDRTMLDRDRVHLYRVTRSAGCQDRMRYHHLGGGAEVLLAVPDAVGWAFMRGGEWRARVAPLVAAVVDV